MRKCLFDTNALSIIMRGTTPEKWSRIWREIRMGQRGLVLIEPVVSELYYKNISRFGKKNTRDLIYGFKSMPRAEIHELDDNDAINAGAIKIDYSSYGLSLVDCFLLAVGRRLRADVVTTDPSVREAGRKLGVKINFISFTNL